MFFSVTELIGLIVDFAKLVVMFCGVKCVGLSPSKFSSDRFHTLSVQGACLRKSVTTSRIPPTTFGSVCTAPVCFESSAKLKLGLLSVVRRFFFVEFTDRLLPASEDFTIPDRFNIGLVNLFQVFCIPSESEYSLDLTDQLG